MDYVHTCDILRKALKLDTNENNVKIEKPFCVPVFMVLEENRLFSTTVDSIEQISKSIRVDSCHLRIETLLVRT